MTTKMQQHQVEWRRAKVMELLSKGESNQSEISRMLQVDRSIICGDIAFLRQQSKDNIRRYIDERLPEEYLLYSIIKYALCYHPLVKLMENI